MYTIILKKGEIELELTTDDKFAVEKQLEKIIHQASCREISSNKSIEEITPANKPVNEENNLPEEKIEQPQNEEPKIENNNQSNVQNIENTYQVKPAVFQHINQEEKQAIIGNAEDVIPQSLDVSSAKPVTINSIQSPKTEAEAEKTADFDKILTNEISVQNEKPPVLKDDKFVQYVEGKSALEKIDFLVVTAQYLAQYEGMNTFNLKHINAKLMQNFTLIVDHSVLQSAISKELITKIQENNDDVLSEYMLTEKGVRSY